MSRLQLSMLLLVLGLLGAVGTAAQSRGWGLQVGETPPERTGFTFCRLMYRQVRQEALGQGYSTDYPGADENLMIRLSELTKTEVTWYAPGQPAHAIVRPTDPGLFQCPFLFASDVGTVGFNPADVEALRLYLMKGGFLWVDDFWGPLALTNWLMEIGRVLPGISPVELSVQHPLFSTFYFVEEVPQIPSIQYWRGSGGATSERGYQSADPHIYGLIDDNGRLLVLMSHNTDIADGWEREGEDFNFFHLFSPRGYAVGVNVAIWSMTH
jgi:hypothetical protein